MTKAQRSPWQRKARSSVVAVLLGTALSTLAPSIAQAAENGTISQEVLADVSRYCTACWRNARLQNDRWSDCTQEVLCRLLERVPAESWNRMLSQEGDERRELIRAIDTIKKREQRRRKWSSEPLALCADRKDPHRQKIAEDRVSVQQVAKELLTPRQQQIINLAFDGWSVQEIGREMKLPPERISDEKYKAIRKLQSRFAPDRSESAS